MPDVIISDIMMPGMTGLELIRAIRALPGQGDRPTPAIAVSAYPYHHERNAALEAGFDAFLVKPVDPLVIVSYVEALYELGGPPGGPGDGGPQGSAERE
jgi:CheY-like chemotaxis protein